MAVEDISPGAAYAALREDPEALLVDVRTDAEWNFVGLPDLSAAGRQPVLIPWQLYPSMQVNGAFADHLRRAGATPLSKLYFLCRSGARSLAAAQAAQDVRRARDLQLASSPKLQASARALGPC